MSQQQQQIVRAKRQKFDLSPAERRELAALPPIEGAAWRWWTGWAARKRVSLKSISCEQQLGQLRITALPLDHDAPHEFWPSSAHAPKRPSEIPEIARFIAP